MKVIKKILNLQEELSKRLDEFIQNNPEANFSLIAHQALMNWLDDEKSQALKLNRPSAITRADVENLFDKRENLMRELAK
jgi:hypothetical protein